MSQRLITKFHVTPIIDLHKRGKGCTVGWIITLIVRPLQPLRPIVRLHLHTDVLEKEVFHHGAAAGTDIEGVARAADHVAI